MMVRFVDQEVSSNDAYSLQVTSRGITVPKVLPLVGGLCEIFVVRMTTDSRMSEIAEVPFLMIELRIGLCPMGERLFHGTCDREA